MVLPSRVQLIDVGPRDGLQNEKQPVPAAVKIELVHRLQAAGLKEIEVTSYVSPKWVPQMADNHDVVEAALAAGIAVRGAMSCTVGCPYEGEVAPERVALLARLMKGIGVQRVDVADTIGVGTPLKVQRAIEATLPHFDIDHICGHFHDTYGQALSNTYAALQMGVWNFQSSVAGLGGCPYAKGATGNVASEDVVYLLQGLGIYTGIDLDALVDAGAFISSVLGRKPNSRVATALLNKRAG